MLEDSRVGDEELLVARSNKRCRKICGGVQFMSEDGEYDGRSSREVEAE